jgi:hypothetical protein
MHIGPRSTFQDGGLDVGPVLAMVVAAGLPGAPAGSAPSGVPGGALPENIADAARLSVAVGDQVDLDQLTDE